MGSSSKKQGNQQVMPKKAAAPAPQQQGDPLTWSKDGIATSFKPVPTQPQAPVSPERAMLAQVMSQRNLPGRWVDRLGLDPNRITHGSRSSWRGGGDQGGQHASGGRGFW